MLGIECRVGESMQRHTSLHIGGAADCLAVPKNEAEIRKILSLCTAFGLQVNIIGNGTNLLVADSGVRGMTIKIGPAFSGITRTGNSLSVLAGTPLINVCEYAAKNSLSGLEFASGIPGTVGGAVFMNAGAYGGEIKDVLKNACVLTKNGEVRKYAAADCRFAYRESRFQSEPESIITFAELELVPASEADIRARMAEHKAARQKSQPLDFPNAGSAFKRPGGNLAAAAMIDACGLKGARVGGAEISRKHAGFIINAGNASAEDVRGLLKLVSVRVYEQYSVRLTPEYCFLGEFGEQDGKNR